MQKSEKISEKLRNSAKISELAVRRLESPMEKTWKTTEKAKRKGETDKPKTCKHASENLKKSEGCDNEQGSADGRRAPKMHFRKLERR